MSVKGPFKLAACCLIMVLVRWIFSSQQFKVSTQYSIGESKNTSESVCIKLQGRLGNCMFQYASILGLAYMTKARPIIVDEAGHLRNTFVLSNNRVQFSKCSANVTIAERVCCAFAQFLIRPYNSKPTRVNGYLQSWKYFSHIEEIIRNEFTFIPKIALQAQFIIRNIASKLDHRVTNITYVGVHVRRGDFLREQLIDLGYVSVTVEFLLKAMHTFLAENGPDTVFIVCSDDIKWIKGTLAGNHSSRFTMFFMEHNTPALDLAVLSHCNHTIATTGTFSWWAAWLTGGRTIIYGHQAREGSILRKQFNYGDYFYPGWTILD